MTENLKNNQTKLGRVPSNTYVWQKFGQPFANKLATLPSLDLTQRQDKFKNGATKNYNKNQPVGKFKPRDYLFTYSFVFMSNFLDLKKMKVFFLNQELEDLHRKINNKQDYLRRCL